MSLWCSAQPIEPLYQMLPKPYKCIEERLIGRSDQRFVHQPIIKDTKPSFSFFSLLLFSLKSLFAALLPGKVAIINGVLSLFTSEQQVDLNS